MFIIFGDTLCLYCPFSVIILSTTKYTGEWVTLALQSMNSKTPSLKEQKFRLQIAMHGIPGIVNAATAYVGFQEIGSTTAPVIQTDMK